MFYEMRIKEEYSVMKNQSETLQRDIYKRIGDKPRLNYDELEDIAVTEYNH